MQTVGMVHIRQIVEYVERKIYIDLIERIVLFTQLSDFLLFRSGFLGLSESVIEGALGLGLSGCLEQPMHLFLHLLEVLLLGLVLLGVEGSGRLPGRRLTVSGHGLALVAHCCVGFHGSAQSLLGGATHRCGHLGSRADLLALVARWRRLLLFNT
jgi:hypothetical protein